MGPRKFCSKCSELAHEFLNAAPFTELSYFIWRRIPAAVAQFQAAINTARSEAKSGRLQAASPRRGRSLTPRQLAVAHTTAHTSRRFGFGPTPEVSLVAGLTYRAVMPAALMIGHHFFISAR